MLRSAGISQLPKGITTKAPRNPEKTMYGASRKSFRSADAGMMSSFWMFLTPSASHWSKPWGPTRLGPTRDCMRAHTRRSSQLVTPASGATKNDNTAKATATAARA